MNALPAIAGLAVALGAVWLIVRSVKRGKVHGEEGLPILKDQTPRRFYMEIAGWIVIALVCLGLAVWSYWYS